MCRSAGAGVRVTKAGAFAKPVPLLQDDDGRFVRVGFGNNGVELLAVLASDLSRHVVSDKRVNEGLRARPVCCMVLEIFFSARPVSLHSLELPLRSLSLSLCVSAIPFARSLTLSHISPRQSSGMAVLSQSVFPSAFLPSIPFERRYNEGSIGCCVLCAASCDGAIVVTAVLAEQPLL